LNNSCLGALLKQRLLKILNNLFKIFLTVHNIKIYTQEKDLLALHHIEGWKTVIARHKDQQEVEGVS
jgi:phosphoserine phosphatase